MKLLHPCPGATISQRFGENPLWYAKFGMDGHNGVDLVAPERTAILAMHDGRVWQCEDPTGYGLYVYLVTDGYATVYAHLRAFVASNCQDVKAGEIIGELGHTGWCVSSRPGGTGAHVHVGLRLDDEPKDNGYKGYVDPEPYWEDS